MSVQRRDRSPLQRAVTQALFHKDIHFGWNSTLRRFRSPIARAAWIDFLIANERDGQAAKLGYVDPFLDPHGRRRPSDGSIERAWLELEATITIQYFTRSFLENVYHNRREARKRAEEEEMAEAQAAGGGGRPR